MASYSYVNGVYTVTTNIRNGFKRFHKCNAQESRFVLNDNDGISRFIVWQFISYATPIIQIVKDMKWDTWIVTCNSNPFGYSPTTSKQIGRWMREHAFPFSAYDLKDAYKNANAFTPELSSYCFNDGSESILFDFYSADKFARVWR